MASIERDKTLRKVHADGVRFRKQWYAAEFLTGWVGNLVHVQLSLAYHDAVEVFDPESRAHLGTAAAMTYPSPTAEDVSTVMHERYQVSGP